MNKFKKLFASFAIVALLASAVPTAVLGNADNYSTELQGAYDYAYSIGSTTMSTIDEANIHGNLIRSHMAKMMSEYAKEILALTPDTSAPCLFTDIANETEEMKGFIIEACQLGLMGQDITAFNPNGVVTRAEFGTVLSRALYGDAHNGGTPYYADHLEALKDAGIMTNISNPNGIEMRGRVMLMMQRSDPEYVAPVEEEEEEEVQPGFATISRVGSVSTQYVAKNAVNKNIGTIKLTAGENDTTVSSVVITHSGLGVSNDVTVQLYNNGVAVSNSRAMTSSSQSATLRFTPALVLKARSSMNFDVMASVNGEVNEEHNFAVTTVNVANGTASGTPIALSTLLTTSYEVGNTIPTLAAYTLKAGDVNELVLSVSIIPSINTIIKGVTFTRNSGKNIDEVLSNAKAYYNDEEVGTVTVTNEKIVVSGLNIERLNGETANIEIKANGIYIGTDGDVDFKIEANDVAAVEKVTNENMRNIASAVETLDVDDVDMTFTKMTTGSQTVAPGTSSVELLNLKLTANTEFEVSNYTISFIDTTEDLASFIDTGVTMYINGVDYPINATDVDYVDGTMQFNGAGDRFFVDKNNPVTIRVLANVKSTVAAADLGKTYQMKFLIEEVKNIENGNTIPGLNYFKNGDTTTINVGTYTVTKPTIPSNKTVGEGTDADLLYFNLKASAENQILKGVTVDAGGIDFDDYMSSLTLMQGTTVVKTIDEADLGVTSILIDGFSKTLTKDTSVPFTVRAALKNGDVTTLGADIQLSITDLEVKRSADIGGAKTTTSSTIPYIGNTYKIASGVPTITLPTQVEKNTAINIANTSSYDIVVTSIEFDVTRNLVGGTTYAQWGNDPLNPATTSFLDAIGGLVFGTPGTVTAPGTSDYKFDSLDNGVAIPGAEQFVIPAGSVDYNIELIDTANTITDAEYTVTVKKLFFYYRDRTDPTDNSFANGVIEEAYNVSK